MAKSGKGKGNGGGPGGGGDDGGGDGGGNGSLIVADGGDDRIRGGNGFETVVYSGSVWDFDYRTGFKGAWIVEDMNPSDGDLGRDELIRIDALQFDDATVYLDRNNPMTYTAPDRLRITVDETVSFAITATDYDDDINGITINPEYDFGYLGLVSADVVSNRLGDSVTYTYSYDPRDKFQPMVQTSPDTLALGEVSEQVFDFRIQADEGWVTHTLTIEVVGLNDAPEMIDGYYPVQAVHGTSSDALDLAAIGTDVDSDDDGGTLRYEIVSAPEGFGARIDGTVLTLAGGTASEGLDSDEWIEGELTVRAIDRHGAMSEAAVIDLTLFGSGTPDAPFLTPAGDIDWSAIGVVPGSGQQFATLNGLSDDPSLPGLIEMGDGDDLLHVDTALMRIFQADTFFYEASGITNYESLPINAGDGDDRLIFEFDGIDLAGAEIVEMGTGWGDDIVVATAESGGTTLLNGFDVYTSQGSDQVLIDLTGDTEALYNGTISTGSGHDVVNIRVGDSDTTADSGYYLVSGRFDLGSGDDVMNVEVSGARALGSWGSVRIDARDGDDQIRYSNAGVSNNPDYWILAGGGLDGDIELGRGSDVLHLNLSEALRAQELFIDGGYSGASDDEYDIVVLEHLTLADEFTFSGNAATGQVSIQHLDQRIDTVWFEEVLLADGTNLLDLV